MDPLALVQISPSARRAHDGRSGRQHAGAASRRAERGGGHRADQRRPSRRGSELRRQPGERSRCADRSLRKIPAGRLLLQKLLPPEGRLEILGAHHPPARRPWESQSRRAPRLFRQGLFLVRCCRDRRRSGRHGRGAPRRARRRRRASRRREPRARRQPQLCAFRCGRQRRPPRPSRRFGSRLRRSPASR